MIETLEALHNLDSIMSTPNLDGIYIGPSDLSLAIGQKPLFDNPEGSPTYEKILEILECAKKYNIITGVHNASVDYAKKMIDLGFNIVTVGSDKISMQSNASNILKKLKNID